jgi:hypothetical protein
MASARFVPKKLSVKKGFYIGDRKYGNADYYFFTNHEDGRRIYEKVVGEKWGSSTFYGASVRKKTKELRFVYASRRLNTEYDDWAEYEYDVYPNKILVRPRGGSWNPNYEGAWQPLSNFVEELKPKNARKVKRKAHTRRLKMKKRTCPICGRRVYGLCACEEARL